MKSTHLSLVYQAELRGFNSSEQLGGRIRFNNDDTIWEYSNDAGSNWYPFNAVRTVNGQTGDIVIGGFAANTCYVVGDGGDDDTAEIGNILRPYETIGAAINAAKDIPGSLIEVLPGTYDLYDEDCPYGLKYPDSYYSFYFHPNTFVNYYGTYGFYISDIDSDGDIYGFGNFTIYSSSFSASIEDDNSGTLTGYGMVIQVGTRSRRIEFNRLVFENTSTSVKGVFIGYSGGTNVNFFIGERLLARGGETLTLGKGSRSNFTGGSIQSTSNTSKTLIINGITSASFNNMQIFSYGNAFSRNASIMGEITYNNTYSNDIKFNNCEILFIGSTTGYKLFNITNNVATTNLLFYNCILKGRQNDAQTLGGYAISSDVDNDIKFISTYSSLNIGGTGTITNLIAGGVGFIYTSSL